MRGMRVKSKRTDLAEVLQKTALFSSLSQPELHLLAARTIRKTFRAGEALFHEGQHCKGFHIISRGQVRMFKASSCGREQVLAVNVPGESVGEIPVFDDGPYAASGIAIEDTEIAFISRKDFRECCLAHPEVALKVLAFVAARLRRLIGIIEELSFTTTRQRLVSLLVRLAQCDGRKTARGIEVLLPGNNQELANQLGTVREVISRHLMRLQAEGLLEVDARQIAIKDVKRLAALLKAA
jgi:CRP/FNR family transcriptional regulator, cyclic AMP receptor protein